LELVCYPQNQKGFCALFGFRNLNALFLARGMFYSGG
jgi:hypothetical protein